MAIIGDVQPVGLGVSYVVWNIGNTGMIWKVGIIGGTLYLSDYVTENLLNFKESLRIKRSCGKIYEVLRVGGLTGGG